jgi:3-oxoacyl-[acyl-carrier protein] reductase
MNLELKDRIALVAASSKGLGKAVAVALAKEGVHLALCARTPEPLKKTAEEITSLTGVKVLSLPTDVRDLGQVKNLVTQANSRLGPIDILVTNAGGPPFGQFLDHAPEAWEEALRLNLLSTIHLTREVVPSMKERRWGRIINITSYSVKQPAPGLILSNTARSGVIGFAKTLATELAPYNVLVNSLCPGVFLTERHYELSRARAQRLGIPLELHLKERVEEIPMKRGGKPEEFADLVVFLASERASYLTGATIQIDGGLINTLL